MSQTLTARTEARPSKLEATESVVLIEADATLVRLADDFSRKPREAVTVVTHRGKPALAVLPWEYYESLMETLEVMGDEEAMAVIRHYQQSINSSEEIKTYGLDEVTRELGL